MPEKNKKNRKIARKESKITVSHLNIRQSIAILLAKLIFLELIASVIFLIFHPVLFSSQLSNVAPFIDIYSSRLFILAVFIKMILTIYIVLSWLNEYYEVTSKLVRHKKGILFVHKEQLALADIQSITLHQGLIGKLFNFGTLSLYDWKWRKHEYLYDIHNPTKYLDVIEELLPGIDEEKEIFISEHLFREREEKERG